MKRAYGYRKLTASMGSGVDRSAEAILIVQYT